MIFQEIIIKWYNENKRDLPWRETKDPYKIWISEIILQQTRVKQANQYYLHFIAEFPDINTLALSPLEKVLKAWQGLGYYSRARNLHESAQFIMKNKNGVFPDNYENLIQLKGIGEYTAAAIASIAYNLPHAVIDGNVYRVLSRVFGVNESINTTKGKKIFKELANELLINNNPSIYNQAIMEFGAVQCIPQKPGCSKCPLDAICFAYTKKMVHQFPLKTNKIIIESRFFYYLVIKYKNYTFINKRHNNDIWASLYEFPLIEMKKETTEEDIIQSGQWNALFNGTNVFLKKISPYFKHVLSHRIIFAKYFLIEIQDIKDDLKKKYIQIPFSDINKYPVSQLIVKIINDLSSSKK